MEECGQQLRRFLESPSIPQANYQLLLHLTEHLCRVVQHEAPCQASSTILAEAYGETLFRQVSSAGVNPELHVKIAEALIMAGDLAEMQAAPGIVTAALACSFPAVSTSVLEELL
ncbi:phosphatidylinositol 3-kinase regulatory subunit gamma-like isoform X1 [Arapaima gigas]